MVMNRVMVMGRVWVMVSRVVIVNVMVIIWIRVELRLMLTHQTRFHCYYVGWEHRTNA